MCPAEKGLTVELSLVMPGKILECKRHFCQPKDRGEALRLLQEIICGVGCAALEHIPVGVNFGIGLCVSVLKFDAESGKNFDMAELPFELAAYTDTFKMRPRQGRKPGRR